MPEDAPAISAVPIADVAEATPFERAFPKGPKTSVGALIIAHGRVLADEEGAYRRVDGLDVLQDCNLVGIARGRAADIAVINGKAAHPLRGATDDDRAVTADGIHRTVAAKRAGGRSLEREGAIRKSCEGCEGDDGGRSPASMKLA